MSDDPNFGRVPDGSPTKGADSPRQGSHMSRRVLAVALAVVLVVVSGGVAGFFLLENHTVCSGTDVGYLHEWTPLVLLNSPYNGNATGVGERTIVVNGTVIPTVGGFLNATNGEAKGLFTLDSWEIVRYSNTTQSGWGSSLRCSFTYQGIELGASNIELTKVLLPPNTTSDANESWSFLFEGYPSVVFYNSLPGNGDEIGHYNSTGSGAGLGFCGPWTGPPPSAVELSKGFVDETVLVPFTLGGSLSYAPGSVPDLLAYNYDFFPNGTWSWYFPPSGGLAFEYAACPS
jgi:hypothetical protein